jgi:hypothetical protein
VTRQIEYADGTGAQTLNTAGTPYTIPLPCRPGLKVALDSLVYTAGATAHKATLMRALDRTTLTAAPLTNQAVINIAANVGAGLATGANAIAAGDWLIIKSRATGILYPVKVSSVSSLAITLTANVPYAFAVGDPVYFYGIAADIEPETGLAHPAYALAASTTVTVSNSTGNGLAASSRMGEPVLLFIDNVTAQGTVNQVNWLGVFEPGSPISGLMGESRHQQPEEVIGGALAKLPWGSIVGGLLKLLTGVLGGATTPTQPAPTQNPSPLGGLVSQLAAWLAQLIQQSGQQRPGTPPVPQVPTTTGS